jgi:hypothetical protein
MAWNDPLVLYLLAPAVTLGSCFVVVETWWAKEPIFAIKFLWSRNVIIENMVTFFQTAAQLGVSDS